MTQTQIISNGSKWAGEAPDSIGKLIQVLKDNTIESRFFGKYMETRVENPKPFVLCPISKTAGEYVFFGNFEEVSHVFNIRTTDPVVIKKLRTAIVNNKGWQSYLHRCKHTSR